MKRGILSQAVSPAYYAMTDKIEEIKQLVRDAAREVVLDMIADHGYTVTPYAGAWLVRGAHYCVVFTCLESICPSQLKRKWRSEFDEVEDQDAVEELESLEFGSEFYDYA